AGRPTVDGSRVFGTGDCRQCPLLVERRRESLRLPLSGKSAMSFTVAIIGRPNVGKSTLFNRLVGRQLALVDDLPGVTRDRREGEGHIADLAFRVVDTAGLDEAPPESLGGRVQAQTGRSLDDADVALLLIDARAGVTPAD